jgi:hypothetical protein
MIGNLAKTQTGVFVFHHAHPKTCKISEYTIVDNSIEELEELYEKDQYSYVEATDLSTEQTKCVQIVAASNIEDYNEYLGLDRSYRPSFDTEEYKKKKEEELQTQKIKTSFWFGVIVTAICAICVYLFA